MSEHQYYEFQAIDRPLGEREMAQLRAVSTRARITPTSFVNDYSWGNFKGNSDHWMDNYFDAFLYIANWGTHVLKLRLPSRLLDPQAVRPYADCDGLSLRHNGERVILTFEADTDDRGDWSEGEGQLARLLPLRADLARGDLRALYLGWLACLRTEEPDEEELEPPVPPGLAQLNGPLAALAEFLYLDQDLIAAAAQASGPAMATTVEREEVRAWVAALPPAQKDELLVRLVADEAPGLAAELLQRLLRERRAADPEQAPAPRRRSVAELLRTAAAIGEERRRVQAQQRAAQKARREQEAAASRAAHLERIAGLEPNLWGQVDELIANKQSKSYDQAVTVLLDLRDLAVRDGRAAQFAERLAALRERHGRKGTFLERLRKAKL